MPKIPLFRPDISASEAAAVAAALQNGELSGNFSPSVQEFENAFASYCGVRHGIAVNSGTSALQLAVAAAGIGAGDEVLISASTNVAPALACYHNGAVPVPVDSEKLTWNLNLEKIESLITEKTRAIIPVHLFGNPVEMDRLLEIARKHRLLVIEDAAEAHGAEIRGRRAGSFGAMGCFSFYASKHITTGEGGMVVTNNDAIAERLRYLRNMATGPVRFVHQDAGFNFRMPGYVASLGLVQMKRLDENVRKKREISASYNECLREVEGLQLPHQPDWAKHASWMYAVVVGPDFVCSRDELMKRLADAGIQSHTFNCPMDQQPFLQKMPGWRDVKCPVAAKLWQQGLYLPTWPGMTAEMIEVICEVIRG